MLFTEKLLKRVTSLFLLFSLFYLFNGCGNSKVRILVFSKTGGFRHNSIKDGKIALLKLGVENGFRVDTTENADYFCDDSLKNYSCVVFLSTTGNILDINQKIAFERYIQSGGGFVGIHAASDTEYGWKWYAKLVGGNFESHPENQEAVIHITDPKHPATEHLPAQWKRFDEWYNFKNLNPDVHVLGKLDETTYKGGKHGDNHPLIWCHEYDGGRAFYTACGHTEASYTEPDFLKHIAGGIKWAIGSNSRNYSKAKSKYMPDPTRFSKQIIKEGLSEPMYMAVDKKGILYYVERRGGIFSYNPSEAVVKTIGNLEVEDYAGFGVMSICLDPDFEANKSIYLYYHTPDLMYRASRFKLVNGMVDRKSEQIVIEFPMDKEPGAHTGGSMFFDNEGNLFLTVGDNTPPWQAEGYPPTDEREGREIYDAQRSSPNTNDLRGKILRIKPNPYKPGYTIPEGNLFATEKEKCRPEIYIMGCRNPWRASYDTRTNTVYWGEVGPDAKEDSELGPNAYDEINQAKKPGNYGWPYFVADNKAYPLRDFATNKPGKYAVVEKPENFSKNNTGLNYLPPAQKAFIWYPYNNSPEFPELGNGARTACAGPVYYSSNYRSSTVKFPPYYDGALLIYEWMRDKFWAVFMNEDGSYSRMEPIMQNLTFDHPTHAIFAPDGSLYVLEYGTIWYSKNDNARLSRITYNPMNRPPVPVITASDSVVAVNAKIKFSAADSYDLDNHAIQFKWYVDNTQHTTAKEFEHIFTAPGAYTISLYTTDVKGATANVKRKIIVGNSYPNLEIVLSSANTSFFWKQMPIYYKINISDKEDGVIDSTRLRVYMNYLPDGEDIMPAMLTGGHMETPKEPTMNDNPLIAKSDCKGCHAINKKSVGPSFKAIAARYKNPEGWQVNDLAYKIINGGGGVWGEHAMSAHPQISQQDAIDMVKYIISLGNEPLEKVTKKLTSTGVIVPQDSKGVYYLSASYTDKGSNGIGSLSKNITYKLRNARIEATERDSSYKTVVISSVKEGYKNFYVGAIAHGSFVKFKNIDLSNIESLTFRTNSKDAEGTLEVRIGAHNGAIVAELPVKPAGAWEKWSETTVPVKETTGKHNLYFVFKDKTLTKGDMMNLDWVQFNLKTPQQKTTI